MGVVVAEGGPMRQMVVSEAVERAPFWFLGCWTCLLVAGAAVDLGAWGVDQGRETLEGCLVERSCPAGAAVGAAHIEMDHLAAALGSTAAVVEAQSSTVAAAADVVEVDRTCFCVDRGPKETRLRRGSWIVGSGKSEGMVATSG